MSETNLTIEMPAEEVLDLGTLGEGIELKNRRTVEFTPDFAANFLEHSEFRVGDDKVDRKLDEKHVIHLAREMLSGNFRWEQVNLVLAYVEGHDVRLNGQHCCWSRLYADEQGLDKKARCPVQVLKYECHTIQDARKLYASLDSGKPRSQGVKIAAHLLGSEEFPGYRAGQLRLIASGLAMWLWEARETRSLHRAEDRAFLLLKDYHKLALQVGTLVKESKASDFRHMNRAPVVAAMFETFSKAPAISRDFWLSVRDGIGLAEKDDARYVLREYLKNSIIFSSVRSSDMNPTTEEEMYRACVLMWNVSRTAGKRIKHIRVPLGEDRPKAR